MQVRRAPERRNVRLLQQGRAGERVAAGDRQQLPAALAQTQVTCTKLNCAHAQIMLRLPMRLSETMIV